MKEKIKLNPIYDAKIIYIDTNGIDLYSHYSSQSAGIDFSTPLSEKHLKEEQFATNINPDFADMINLYRKSLTSSKITLSPIAFYKYECVYY